MKKSDELGKENITPLIFKQSIPASIGMLVMSVYMIVDTIFVGQWVGALAIAAITVVLPITFLISSIGMAIGVGGGSIISRALGSGDDSKASITFGNQIFMAMGLAFIFVIVGYIFGDSILKVFGGKGDILQPAKDYFNIILLGVPLLAFAMMSNNNIRAIGYPKVAMWVLLLPAIANIILDPIFIKVFDMGLKGAAWATIISYCFSAGYGFYFLFIKNTDLRITWKCLVLKKSIVSEISSLGGVTLARQGVISLLSIVLNNALFNYGNELYVAVYGIINRVMMLSLFPVLGLTQGTLPIIGYNYGAKKYARVKETVKRAIIFGTITSVTIYIIIILFRNQIVIVFTDNEFLLENTPYALLIVFSATPFILTQLIGSAYFQAIGKALPALLLTLSKQGFFLIPLIFILPLFFGIDGIWISFPVADILSVALTFIFLRRDLKKLPVDNITTESLKSD